MSVAASQGCVAEAAYNVVVDHSHCLHEGVTNGRTNKRKTPPDQVFA